MRKKSVEWTTNRREREGTPYYIIYIGRGGPPPALPGREGEGETENGKLTDPLRRFAPRPPDLEGQRKRGAGGVFMNERKPGGKNEMPRNAKTRTRRIIFCPPERINMLSGNTRTSHPGGQGRVVREDGKQCKDRWDKACGCFLIIGFRETGGQTCLLY